MQDLAAVELLDDTPGQRHLDVAAAPGRDAHRRLADDDHPDALAVRGRWRVIWGRDEEHHVDLDPLDVCSVPPFVPRRFINIERAANGEIGLLLTVQPGNAPNVEFLNKE